MGGVEACEVGEDAAVVFGGGGDVAADGGEALGSVEASELAGDFGLELDHA